MKRSLICVLLVGCFCLGLCGCGAMDRTDNPVLETPLIPQATAELLPVPDVMETPDMEDGFVQDGDGVIEDRDTGRELLKPTPIPNETQESPSPEPNSIP